MLIKERQALADPQFLGLQRKRISFLWIIQRKSASSLTERTSLMLCRLVP